MYREIILRRISRWRVLILERVLVWLSPIVVMWFAMRLTLISTLCIELRRMLQMVECILLERRRFITSKPHHQVAIFLLKYFREKETLLMRLTILMIVVRWLLAVVYIWIHDCRAIRVGHMKLQMDFYRKLWYKMLILRIVLPPPMISVFWVIVWIIKLEGSWMYWILGSLVTKKIAAVYIIVVSRDLCMMAYYKTECRYIVCCRVVTTIYMCLLDKLCLIEYLLCILSSCHGTIQLQLM